MGTAREIDANGFMTVKACPISSFGIFEYSAGQLGLDGDPNRIVNVFRPESAVSDPEAIESFKNVPFIIDHEMLSGFEGDEENTAPEEYGTDGVMTGNVYYEKPWMRADLRIFSRRAQQALESGKKDLSLGYSCDFEMKPGVFNGTPYEVIQTNMRGNHIALVDEGRVPGARVLDGRVFDHLNFNVWPSNEDSNMAKKQKTARDSAVEQLRAALNAFLNEEAKEPEHGGAEGGGEGADPSLSGGDTDPSMSNEGGEGGDPAAAEAGGEGGGDVASLIKEAQALLMKLEAQASGGAAGDEGNAGEEGGEEGGEAAVEDMSKIGADDDEEGTAEDGESNEGGEGEGNGKASPGPSGGKNTRALSGDAAVRRVYADIAAKGRLYNRISEVHGAFDCSRMDARQVAVYGVKKFGLKNVKDGAEISALEVFFAGRDSATRSAPAARRAADATVRTAQAEMDAYFNGSK